MELDREIQAVMGMRESQFYNDVPETQGIARNKGTYSAPTARDNEDAAKLAAFRAQQGDNV